MRYIIAFFLPPLAVLLCGRPLHAFLSVLLTLLGWVPGFVHAVVIVARHKANRDARRIAQREVARALQRQARAR